MSVADFNVLAPLTPVPRMPPLGELPWPELGHDCMLNCFYRHHVSASGFLGESYVVFWTLEEIAEDAYDISSRFEAPVVVFGTNGGGELFAAIARGNKAEFLLVPSIGDQNDTLELGGWDQFIRKLKTGSILQ